MWWDNGYGWGGWWFLMPLVMVAFWGTIIWAVVTVVRGRPASPPASPTGRPGSEEILADRYARGEINDDDYRQRLATLRGATPTGEGQ